MKTDRESYYFRHYSDTRNDPKIIRLIMSHGMEGYGIFWAILEMLRTAKNYEICYDPETIAHQLSINCATIKAVCENTKLFEITNEMICSPSLKKFLTERSEIYRRNRFSSIKSDNSPTIVNQLTDKARILKESKVKERKENKAEPSFIEQLKTLPAYAHINIETEISKIDAWLLVNKHRTKTKRFIINWLNRIEKPMSIEPTKALGWGRKA